MQVGTPAENVEGSVEQIADSSRRRFPDFPGNRARSRNSNPSRETILRALRALSDELAAQKSAQDVLELIARYYPENLISVKIQYLIDGLFEVGRI